MTLGTTFVYFPELFFEDFDLAFLTFFFSFPFFEDTVGIFTFTFFFFFFAFFSKPTDCDFSKVLIEASGTLVKLSYVNKPHILPKILIKTVMPNNK